MASEPSALVGGVSLALTTASELGGSNCFKRRRFPAKSSEVIGPVFMFIRLELKIAGAI